MEKEADSNDVICCSVALREHALLGRRADRLTPAGFLSVSVKSAAVNFQPVSSLLNVFCELANDAPELFGMVHLN
jgi:hypothetical protein